MKKNEDVLKNIFDKEHYHLNNIIYLIFCLKKYKNLSCKWRDVFNRYAKESHFAHMIMLKMLAMVKNSFMWNNSLLMFKVEQRCKCKRSPWLQETLHKLSYSTLHHVWREGPKNTRQQQVTCLCIMCQKCRWRQKSRGELKTILFPLCTSVNDSFHLNESFLMPLKNELTFDWGR